MVEGEQSSAVKEWEWMEEDRQLVEELPVGRLPMMMNRAEQGQRFFFAISANFHVIVYL